MDSAITEVYTNESKWGEDPAYKKMTYQEALTSNLIDGTVLQMLEKIAGWAPSKNIADIYKQKGGWEAWLQVELALSTPDLLGGTVTREEHIYSNELGDQRVDLLWNRARQVRYGIELKCQSSGQTVDKGGFYSAFVTDLKKVCISRLKTAYQLNTVLVMLGFGVGGVAVEEAKAVFSSSKIGAGEHDVPCRVYWAETFGGHTLFWAVVDERHLYRAAR